MTRNYGPEDVIIHSQPQTPAYVSQRGQIIRQDNYPDDEMYVRMSVEHIGALISANQNATRYAGFCQLEPEPFAPQPDHPDRRTASGRPVEPPNRGRAELQRSNCASGRCDSHAS